MLIITINLHVVFFIDVVKIWDAVSAYIESYMKQSKVIIAYERSRCCFAFVYRTCNSNYVQFSCQLGRSHCWIRHVHIRAETYRRGK
jgi:hypothetical protein